MILGLESGADPVLEAIRISGPAGGLVVVLGILIKQWFAGLRAQLGKLETSLDALQADATKAQLKAVGDMSKVKTQLEEHSRRIKVVEEKAT